MTTLFELRGIEKTFLSGTVRFQALRGLDCDIAQGDVTALVGPSGSGKSTLLNILGLIERPSAGTLFFAGQDLGSATEAELTEIRRREVGFIFQSFNLLPVLSAVENVEYALHLEAARGSRKATRERAMEVLEALGIAAYAHHRPAQLSGGQRQRVAIARAVVKKPRVIVADEPTANLDTKTAGQIIEIVRDLNRAWGTTVIVATHDQEVAAVADRIIRIEDGKRKGERHEKAATMGTSRSSGSARSGAVGRKLVRDEIPRL